MSDTTNTQTGENNTLFNAIGELAATTYGLLAAKEARESIQDQIDYKKEQIQAGIDTLTECCEAFPAYGTPEEVFGVKPDVADYTPQVYNDVVYNDVDHDVLTFNPTLYNKVLLCEAALRAAQCNCDNFEDYKALQEKTNEQNFAEKTSGLEEFDKYYGETDCIDGQNTYKLTKGILPFEDATKITSDHATFQNFIGTPGCNMPTLLQDLGVRRLSAQREGHARHMQRTQVAHSISQSVFMDMREMFVSPMEMYNAEAAQVLKEYEVAYTNELNDYKNRVFNATNKYKADYQNEINDYKAEVHNEERQYANSLYNEEQSRLNEQVHNDVAAAPNPTAVGMSMQALQCCMNKAAMQAQAASLNLPTIAASQTTYGVLSSALGRGGSLQGLMGGLSGVLSGFGNVASGIGESVGGFLGSFGSSSTDTRVVQQPITQQPIQRAVPVSVDQWGTMQQGKWTMADYNQYANNVNYGTPITYQQ